MLRAAAPALYLNVIISSISLYDYLPFTDVLATDSLEVACAERPDVLLAVACEYPTACGPLATMVSITFVCSMWGGGYWAFAPWLKAARSMTTGVGSKALPSGVEHEPTTSDALVVDELLAAVCCAECGEHVVSVASMGGCYSACAIREGATPPRQSRRGCGRSPSRRAGC